MTQRINAIDDDDDDDDDNKGTTIRKALYGF